MAFNGFSGSFDSLDGVDKTIDAITEYHGNAFRVAFNPQWITGTRPWYATTQYGPDGPTKINRFLQRTEELGLDYTIIVDRTHMTDQTSGMLPLDGAVRSWATVEANVFEVLSLWPNHPRVIVEVINEYWWSEMYALSESIIQRARAAGYNNRFLLNKQTITNGSDWQRFSAEAPSMGFYGDHWYFNNETSEYNKYINAIKHMEWALQYGCAPICNTEIGAYTGSTQDYTQDQVDRLNSFLHWCNDRGIGNMVWIGRDANSYYIPKYKLLGFDPQWVASLPEARLSYLSTPIPVPLLVDGVEVQSGSQMLLSHGSSVNLKVPREVVV